VPHPEPERCTNAPSGPERLLTGLTPEQAQAVTHGTGPLLLIAGPGAGKTRTLLHRIAYLFRPGALHAPDPAPGDRCTPHSSVVPRGER
jgi:UvrD/REP helicase N-terminal domain